MLYFFVPYPKYSIDQYNKAFKLRNTSGFTYAQIASALNVKQRTIISWLREGVIPFNYSEKIRENIKKASLKASQNRIKQLPSNSKQLSIDLAYILGAFKGDGCINGGYPYKNRRKKYYTLTLNTIDYDFAQEFRSRLEKWSGMYVSFTKRYSSRPTWSDQYAVRLYSNTACEFLKYFDLNALLFAKSSIKCAFLRGIYDAEGSVYWNGKRSELYFFNTNPDLVNLVRALLYSLGFSKIYTCVDKHRETPCFRLSLASRFEIKRFGNLIGFSIKRKNDKVLKIINAPDLRGKWLRSSHTN